MSRQGTPGDLWTIGEACAYFAGAGLPVRPEPFRVIIRELHRIETAWGGTRLEPAGHAPPCEQGGRGKALYQAEALMDLHTALLPWLLPRDKLPPGSVKGSDLEG